MKWYGLVRCLYFNLVKWDEYLIIDRSPPIVLNSFIPALMLVIFGLIELNVDCSFSLLFLHLIVVTWSKGIDVNNSSMNEDFIIDKGWELETTQSKSNVTLGGWIKKICLTSIDALQKLIWITLVLEVDQILVILIDSYIRVRSPKPLDLLYCNLILCLQFNFLFSFEITSPCPLNLNGCDMIHCESVVLEKSSG